jgi:hypothetical protein
MKVYLATSGSYSDYQVHHVFAREEDARAYTARLYDGDVEEYELHEGPIEVRTWHTLYWATWQPDSQPSAGRLGNPWTYSHGCPMDYDGNPRHIEIDWRDMPQFKEGEGLQICKQLQISGWDPDRIRKVYSEQRAQFLAQREGVA